MSQFYSSYHDAKDMSLLKRMEMGHMFLEKRAKSAKPKRFKAHPTLLSSESDTSICTPRRCEQRETKKRVHNFHKLLHERLTIVQRCEISASSDFSEIGDSCRVQSRYRNTRSDDSFCFSPEREIRKDHDDKRSSTSRLSSRCRSSIPPHLFEKKFKAVVVKCLERMKEVRDVLDKGIEQPDGKDDEQRRIVKSKEFANRFSRNYLYPLERLIKDLTPIDQMNIQMINYKLLSIYQMILNGLKLVQTQLSKTVGDDNHNQLKILMKNLIHICTIHGSYMRQGDDEYDVEYVDSIRINAELTVQKLDEIITMINNPPIVKLKKPLMKKKKKAKPCNKVDPKYHMYLVGSHKRDLSRKKETKFNVKSKYKTATFKHRPPVEKEEEEPTGFKKIAQMYQMRQLRSARLVTPPNEDSIRTMVEDAEEEKEQMEEKNQINGRVSTLIDALQSHNDGNEDLVKKLIEGLKKMGEEQEEQKLTLQVVHSQVSVVEEEDGRKKRKEPKVTVSGEKNAQLICIVDENSISEADPDGVVEKFTTKTSVTNTKIKKKSLSTQRKLTQFGNLNVLASYLFKARKPATKISRIKKTGRPLMALEQKRALQAIQYKIDFYKHCKKSPMYKKSTTCEPWTLMSRISEKILDGCILEVAREINVDDFINKIYQSELQL